MIRRRTAVLVLALVVALGGCAPPPPAPVHPLGVECTWPADLQPARDGMAVLVDDNFRPLPPDVFTNSVLLYHVATGALRARCSGLATTVLGSSRAVPEEWQTDGYFGDDGVEQFSVSADLRTAITPEGFVDLPTGRLTPFPDPAWPAIALVSGGVLRRSINARSGADDDAWDPLVYCVAERPDSPQEECRPLPGAVGRGHPLVTRAGQVEWVPATAFVPMMLTDPGSGVTFVGVAQPGATEVLAALIGGDDVLDLYFRTNPRLYRPFTRMSGIIDRSAHPLVRWGEEKPLRWYTIDTVGPTAVTGTLHTSTIVDDPFPPCRTGGSFGAGIVEEGGDSIVVSCTTVADEHLAAFVRISVDRPPQVIGHLTLNPNRNLVNENPAIWYWPPGRGASAA